MISANLGHAAQVLSGPDDRAFCSHFGVSDAFDASALVADGAALLRRLGPCHVHCAGYFSCAALRKTLPRLLLAAREVGATTSLDTNNDASGQWGAVDGLCDALLPPLDFFTPLAVNRRRRRLVGCTLASAGSPRRGVSSASSRPALRCTQVLLPLLDLFTPNELEACAVAGVTNS